MAKRFLILAALASCMMASHAQAHTAAELQYQQDQLTLNKAFNRCNEIANAQRAQKEQQQHPSAFYLPPMADIAEAARKAPPLTLEICEANYYRKSDELNARQPQEIKDENARIMREAQKAQDDLNAEAIR